MLEIKTKKVFLTLACLLLTTGCMKAYQDSLGGERDRVVSRVVRTDLNTAWQAVLESLKSSPIDISNREAGYVQTKWTDNTTQRNFIESFGAGAAYLKAQYRFRVSLSEGYYNGEKAVKLNVQKEQVVERDVLEGWVPVESDLIDENTLLYRITRLSFLKMKIAEIEDRKTKKAIQNISF